MLNDRLLSIQMFCQINNIFRRARNVCHYLTKPLLAEWYWAEAECECLMPFQGEENLAYRKLFIECVNIR